MRILFAYDGSESADAAIAAAARGRGNIEGTPARACASTRSYSSSTDSFDLRDFRARCFPCLPSLPASSLDGGDQSHPPSPSCVLRTDNSARVRDGYSR